MSLDLDLGQEAGSWCTVSVVVCGRRALLQ
jgi:hypothetical protein